MGLPPLERMEIETLPQPDVPGVTHRSVRAAGLSFHVAEAGAGDPLLLLHGWPQHWYMWRGVIPELARSYRVICPDLRGLGWSEAPSGGYDKETLANDMLAVMDALGLDRVKLVGHDWGGFTGFLLCLFQPERFERFLALGVVHPWIRLDPTRAGRMWSTAYQWVLASPFVGEWILRNRPEIVENALKGAAQSPDVWTDDELRWFSRVVQQPARAAASVQYYRSFLTREAIPLVTGGYDGYRLKVPTRLLVGRHDPVCSPSMLPGFEKHADDMDADVLEDVGHFMVDESPELIVNEIQHFFSARTAVT